VQVPLHLPPPERGVLRQFCFDGVSEALDLAGIQLVESQSQEFALRFIDGLEPALTTPRMARRYANALMFVLPLLKGEVNIVELLLLDGMRVLYPAVYRFIRDHPSIFLGDGTALFWETALPDGGSQKQIAEKALASAVAGLSPDAARSCQPTPQSSVSAFRGVDERHHIRVQLRH
jgi:predicted KAP-like P-loop ATPase